MIQSVCYAQRSAQTAGERCDYFSPSAAMGRAEWQPLLFSAANRARLLECVPTWRCKPVRLRVNGNHGFAPVASALHAYAAWNALQFSVLAGPYDDTMSLHLEGDADIEIVWLDTARLTGLDAESMSTWLVDRLRVLGSATSNPILCLAFPLASSTLDQLKQAAIPGVQFPDMHAAAAELGAQFLDPRTFSLTGTRLSSRACLQIACELACRWIPASLLPPVKAVVVDLDNTLFAGVLAEDSSVGVALTPAHRVLQKSLLALRDSGMYLALVSRNESTDVETLFAARPDFPLRLSHFSSVQVSWEDKTIALRRIADELRIEPAAMVYVDDNPGELAEVAAQLPVVTVHAASDAAQTARALNHVAGVFRWHRSREDALRADDLGASARRSALASAARSPSDYLRDLRVKLGYRTNDPHDFQRIYELIHKTNQFNLSLRRFNETELARVMADQTSRVVVISLADRLSDSGIIGVVAGRRTGDTLAIEELCVSCRALGRHLEDTMFTHALRILAHELPCSHFTFCVRVGRRNAPARRWLAQYLGLGLHEACSDVSADAHWLLTKPVEELVSVQVLA